MEGLVAGLVAHLFFNYTASGAIKNTRWTNTDSHKKIQSAADIDAIVRAYKSTQ